MLQSSFFFIIWSRPRLHAKRIRQTDAGSPGIVTGISMTVVRWAMVLAPVAVFGLLAQITIKVGLDALLGHGRYVVTVLLGLVILLCIYFVIVLNQQSEIPTLVSEEYKETFSYWLFYFSSAAVMPYPLKHRSGNLKVRPSIPAYNSAGSND